MGSFGHSKNAAMYKKKKRINNFVSKFITILYLVSGVLFILALRGLSSQKLPRQGNLFGIIGMVIAVTVTFLQLKFSSGFIYVLIFLAIGGSIGAFVRIEYLTAMQN